MDDAELMQMLRVQPQTNDYNRNTLKRPSNEPDDSGTAKRSDDKVIEYFYYY